MRTKDMAVRVEINSLIAILMSLLACGCPAKSEIDVVTGQLRTCKEEQLALQKEVRSGQEQVREFKSRRNDCEQTLLTTLPAAARTFHEEQEKVIALLPEAVRGEVGDQLTRYFAAVDKQFKGAQKNNDKILSDLREARNELNETRAELNEARSKLTEIATGVSSVEQKIDQSNLIDERNSEISSAAHHLIVIIQEFDHSKINCN